MATKRFVVVDDTIGEVVSVELTEKQANDLSTVVGPASHAITVQAAGDVEDAPDDA